MAKDLDLSEFGGTPQLDLSEFQKEPEKPRTWGEAAKDTGAALMQGGAGLVKSAGDLYGLASGDMNNAVSQLGQSGQEYWEEAKSGALRRKIAKRKEDIDASPSTLGKAWTAVKETVTDPALAMDTVAGNAATMLPGMAAGRLAAGAKMAAGMKAAQEFGPVALGTQSAIASQAARIGTGVAVGAGAAQQGADVSGDIYGDLMKKPDATWDANPDFAQAVARNGGDREAAKREMATQVARASFLPAAGISAVANAFPGATMLEKALVGGAARDTIKEGTKYALPKAIAKGMAGEGAQEFVEEGGGRLAANIAAQKIADPSHDTWDQVGENAGMGLAGGLLMGAGGGAFHRQAHTNQPTPPEQPPQPPSDQSTGVGSGMGGTESFVPPAFTTNPQPTTLGTQITATAGPGFDANSVLPKSDPVRDMVQQAADAGGPNSAAALVGIDSGAHGIEQQAAAQAAMDEKLKEASKDMPADVADAWAQYRAESAALQQDQSQPDWAAQAADEERQQGPLQIPPKGMNTEQRKANLARLKERMLAGRQSQANPVQSQAEPRPNPGQTPANTRSELPQFTTNPQPTTLGTQTTAQAGPTFDANYLPKQGAKNGTETAQTQQTAQEGPTQRAPGQQVESSQPAHPATNVVIPSATRYQLTVSPSRDGLAPLSKDDADFHLEVLEERARKGKLTPEVFANSEIGQRLDTGSMQHLVASIKSDPIGTIAAIRKHVSDGKQPAQPAANAGEGAGVSQPTQAAKLPPTDIRIGDKVLVDGKPHTVTQGVDGGVAVESDAQDIGSGVSNSQTRILKGDEAIKAKIAADDAGLNKAAPNQPALDRIAAGNALFGNELKARNWVQKNGLAGTHDVRMTKPGRFEVVAKNGNSEQTAPSNASTGDKKQVNKQVVEHSGLKISQQSVKIGDTVQSRWVVQSPENAEREAKGERQIGGDAIVDSREEAVKTAERETARYAEEKARKAEFDRQEQEAKKQAEAKKEANRNKSLLERRADAILDKPTNLPPQAGLGTGTRRESMDKAVSHGRFIEQATAFDSAAKKKDTAAVDLAKAKGYILGLSNENIPVVKAALEAQARLKENKYEKPEYRVYSGSDRNGSFYEISKTEYDYAQSLKTAEQKAPTNTASDATEKVADGKQESQSSQSSQVSQPSNEPSAKSSLSEREKAAKAKMHNALGKLAALATKNTRMNWTAEEEQQLLPIVIELFDGAVELGAVTFQKAVAYVRDFISTNLDKETADAIPFETLQGAYIAMSGRHKDKAITPRKEVVSFDSLEELQASAPQETPAPAEVKQGEKNKSISSAKPSLNGPEGRHAVAQSVADYFIGGGKFDTIIQARKFISELTGEKIESSSKNAKLADETIEMGVVLAGREMVKAGRNQKRSDQTIYDRLVSLYNAQPNLSVRSSTSVEQQAYSTPIPLAFVASRLARIKKGDIVAEPTAGNSALVLEALPAHTVINELNDDRIGNLEAMGFTPTQKNAATEQLAAPKSVDVAVMNPPFGAVKDSEGKTIYFDVPAGSNTPALNTREIDHAIVFNSLETIKDDGRAVLIVGGVDASTDDQIRDGYRGKGKREFYYKLYNEYKVTDHFTVDGGLYSRQGAGYPVDVIVIDGRGKSARDLPAANLPQRIMSYDQLKEKLNEANTLVPTGSGTGVRVGSDPAGVSHGTDVATSSVGAPDGPGIAGAKPGQSIQTGSKGDGVRPILGQSAGSGSVSGGGKLGTSGTPTQPDGTVRGGLVAPAGVSGESGRKAGDGGNRSDDVGGNSSLDGKLVGSGLTDRRGQEAETENQVGYTPKSGKASVGTLVPINMRDAIQESLSKVSDDVGDIDDYVANALGYTSQELGDYLSAEQIDALALAIYNAEKGKGFIIGDQTGIGKGRVNAAMIRYAIKKGQVPIFITEKPNLYADMIRDLDDIGMAKDLDLEGGKPNILMTNNGESIPYELYRNVNGEVVEHRLTLKAPKSNAKDAAALLSELAGNGELGRYKVIFSTYSQLQSIGGKSTERQRFLTAFAKDNFIIFDESHNAGGTGESQDSRAITKVMKAAGATVPGRAVFARNLVKLAKGTFFSSATYAKRPDVMDLYSSTNMSLAVDKPADLAPAIKAGGVPLQQAVATMLTADGQYIRRERTFAGVSYETQLMPIDRKTGENMAESMRWILAFSRAKEQLLSLMQKEFDREGAIAKNMGGEKTQVAGANFGSIMHNLIDQMLLALKVEESVKLAIAKLKSGEKVVLTVSNTMGSFLKDYADEMGIRPGDAVSLSFKDLYLRYLDKQRKYKVKSPGGTVEEKYLTDAELGHLLPMYNKIQAFIQNAGFGSAPISPIDYMHNELRKAGYKTDEITGRTVTVDYEGGIAKLASRTANIKQRLKAIGDFNSGAADVLILNQSGSTGLSLHASSKFKDQKKRHMIIVQAEKNIDTHMQMLGRVHRTGQVVTPGYTQAMADTPAEMRPAAVLSKKMAGLSANTTASRKSAVAAEGVVDFINEYGGQVAAEFLQDNPEVHDALGGQKRIEVPSDLNEAGEDLIRKLTGYIPILPLKQQEQIYADLIERYNDLIARENSMGTNRLETKALDLDAKTLTSEKITANKGSATETSVFAEPANMEQVDVKRNVKPLTPQELEAAINETLNGLTPQQYNTNIAKEFDSDLAKYVSDVLEKMAVTTDNHALVQGQKKDQLFLMGQNIKRILSIYKVGDSVTITDKNASVVHGVITGITHNQKTKNPAAGSAWKMTFALANGDARTMSVGFGQLGQQFSVNVTTGTVPQVTADGRIDRVMIRSLFENGNNIRREKRWMVTGNLLAGFSKYKGQIVSYTKADGGTGQGVLMNRQFDYKKEKGASTLSFSTSAQAIEFLGKAGRNAVLGSPDRVLRIVSLGGERYSVMVPSSKREGGSLYLDRGLLDAFGSDFYKQGQNMSMRIDGNDTLVRGLNYLIAERDDISLAALSNQDVARNVLGMDDDTAAFSRVKFSRTAQGQANGTVEKTVADIVKGWATRPKIVVAFDMNDERIPERVRMEDQKQRSGGASGAPEGFYYKGTVYLMSSKLATPEDVARVLFHEALGHHGLRSVFGKKLNSILNRIAMARKSEVDAKMAQYGLKGISKVDRLTAAEEILAEMAQTKPNIGFVREAIAAIRTWLRENIPGFKNLELTDDEIIRSYILPARNFVERGGAQSFGMFAPSMARDASQRESDVSPIGFYSALARGIEASTANIAPALGWKATIKGLVNKGLAKADEVEWSGVNEWLDMQGGKVAKTQVLDFLRGNGVKVEEVEYSDDDTRAADKQRAIDDLAKLGYAVEDEYGEGILVNNETGARYTYDSGWVDEDGNALEDPNIEEVSEVADVVAEFMDGDQYSSNTKYGNYTLPGGENYREVLLTFPGEYSVGARIAALRAREVAQKMRFAETDEEYELLRKERAELAEKSKGGLVYKSSHWDQPNVLAHIRLNDRTDADGKRVLFVEEVQSDWGQQGKKEGFAGTMEGAKAFYGISDADWNAMSQADRQSYVDEMTGRTAGVKGGVPTAPFVTKTDAWLNLALKRIIKMAVDEGYDKVAFVNGEQSADRYDLSKQVEHIDYVKSAPDRWNIAVVTKSGDDIDRDAQTADQLEDLVGKEVAQKIVGGEGQKGVGGTTLRGLDLKVGGEGMKAFYDSIVPNAVKKLVGKLGGEVGEVEVYKQGRNGMVMPNDAKPAARRDGRLFNQTGFTITPAMREKVAGGLPLFSRTAAIKKAGDVLNEAFNHPGTVSKWHTTVGSMYNLAERSPAFKPVFDAAQNFLNDVSYYATEAADMAPKILPKLESWKDMAKSPISYADNEAIGKPIFQGTLSWARDVSGKPVRIEELEAAAADMTTEQKAQDMLRAGKLDPSTLRMWQGMKEEHYAAAVNSRYESTMLRPGVVWKDAELKRLFNLNDAQIGLYKEFRKAIDTSIDNTAKAGMLRVAGKGAQLLREMVMDAPTAEDAGLLLRDHFQALAWDDPKNSDQLIATANQMMDLADKAEKLKKEGYAPLSRFGQYTVDVVVDGERKYFGLFESKRAANQYAAKAKAEFGAGNVAQGTLSQREFEMFQGITPESLELFGNMLGLDSEGSDAQDKAFQTYLRMTKANRSAMKKMIHRKGIEGYSEDVGRVLAAFVYSNARQTAGALNLGRLGEAVNDIPKAQGELKDVAIGLQQYITQPQEEAQAIRGLMFAQYLGGSVASALVNLTQPMAVSFPYLSQFGGAKKSAAALTKAYADMAKNTALEKALQQALHAAEEQGVVAPQEVHQLMAQARGQSTLHGGDGTKVGDFLAKSGNAFTKLALGWGKLFGVAEQINRRATFIAAYRMAVENGNANPAEFATKAVNETQFINNRGNKMQWGRGAVGATLMTFKSYSINYLELLHRMAFKKGPDGKIDPEGVKAAALMLGMLVLMAGAGGLPFAEDLNDAIDFLAERMGYNFSTKKAKQEFLEGLFGKPMADFVDRGITGLPGSPIDVSGRMSMANLIPATGLLLEKRDHSRDAQELLGPVGDMAKRAFEGANAVLDGDIKRALLSVAPKAISNAYQGADMLDKGYYADAKGYKVLSTTPGEAVAKAIGFQPQSVSMVQESNAITQRMKDTYALHAEKIRSEWAKGVFEHDPDQIQKARDMLKEWNDKNPDQRIIVRIPDVMKKARDMAKDKDQRIADTAPKAMRAHLKQEIMQRKAYQ